MARDATSRNVLNQGLLYIHCEGLAVDMDFSTAYRSARDGSLEGANGDVILSSKGAYQHAVFFWDFELSLVALDGCVNRCHRMDIERPMKIR